MIWRNFKMALSSLGHAKLRSFLTMLGMIIGIGSVVAVLAIGEGVKNEISRQVTDIGTNLINISPGDFSDGNFDFAAFSNSPLTEQDLRSVQEIETVEAATALMLLSGHPSSNDVEATESIVIAITPEYADVLNQEVEVGQNLNHEYEIAEVVLGNITAEQLFPNTNPIGQSVTIRQEEFLVVGVLETFEVGFSLGGFDYNHVAYIHLGEAKELTGGSINLNEIDAIATSAEVVDETAAEIEAVILANHGGVKDFTVMKQDDILDLFDNIFGIVTSFIAAIAAISLLVGGIGIMNIMLVSVTERTREIGIRKAIGANNRHILSQFLIEAVVLSLFGGLLGVGFAYLLSLIVQLQTDITPAVTLGAIGLAVGVSSAIGVIFGLAPAIKAARKNPIEALRYE